MSQNRKRGRPRRGNFNVWQPQKVDPSDPLSDDGKGNDFRVPPPPWDDNMKDHINENCAVLRLDPIGSNPFVRFWPGLAKSMFSDEVDNYGWGRYAAGLISPDVPTNVLENNFAEIIRMRRTLDEPPHPVYHAYMAYLDYVKTHSKDPSMLLLTRHIKKNINRFPVGDHGDDHDKQWWDLFLSAGLSRLANSGGI
jgi:hypothetical protein